MLFLLLFLLFLPLAAWGHLHHESALRERQLLQEASYLAAHEGGASTLTSDAYGAAAEGYYRLLNRLSERGKLPPDHLVVLHRTPTGLELEVH